MNALIGSPTELCLRGTLTLIHFLWQGAAIALVVIAAGWCLRRQSANLRYVVNVSALLLMFACVPATFMLLGASPRPVVALWQLRSVGGAWVWGRSYRSLLRRARR